MTISVVRPVVLASLLIFLHGSSAHALNAKSWVANFGNDGNDCSLAHPCATFQRAHDQTNPGGEIGVLTPGDFGGTNTSVNKFFIGKAINITNDGSGEASISGPPDDAAVVIDSGTGDVVSLRGLVIDGLGSGAQGIYFIYGLALHVQNCVIRNFEATVPGLGVGIEFSPVFRGTRSSIQRLFVSDTIIFNNGAGGSQTGGIFVQWRGDQTDGISIVLDRVHLENNVNGIVIESVVGGEGVHVIVRDSVISGNAANGFHAVVSPGRAPAFAVVERSSIVNNRQNGILAAGPGATLLLSDSTVARNGAGISTVNSGQVISYRNNRINNNIGPDGAPTSFLTLN